MKASQSVLNHGGQYSRKAENTIIESIYLRGRIIDEFYSLHYTFMNFLIYFKHVLPI